MATSARPSSRQLLRIALKMHERLMPATGPDATVYALYCTGRIRETLQRLRTVQERNWPVAERHVKVVLSRQIDELTTSLERAAEPAMNRFRAKAVEILADLQALYDEFPAVTINHRERVVTVMTEEICLEGIELGPFRIKLDWLCLGTTSPTYRVVAVRPDPAAGAPRVTHPHVNSQKLCEGEGQVAIRTALQQGRLLDFFILVRQILETYNVDSAYVKLEAWRSGPCASCGDEIDPDDSYSCSACDGDARYCDGCIGSCRRCDDNLCSDCQFCCQRCSRVHCSDCIETCTDCDDYYCSRCLTDGRCQSCHETFLEEQADADKLPVDTAEA